MSNSRYPVPNRTALRNRRIAAHEMGHAFVARALGSYIHSVTIVPDTNPNGYEGRCMRSGPLSELVLSDDNPEAETDEILSVCERLERLTPELGSSRAASAEYYLRAQGNITELVAGEAAELLLHPELPALGAVHDFIEASAFARIAVAAQPAVASLIDYCRVEASALLTQNRDILDALVEALVEIGTLDDDQIDMIISTGIAARVVEAERLRRIDWREREQNAATFLKGLRDA